MKNQSYTRITKKERIQIETLLRYRHSITEIALMLKRPKSTISREVKRGLSIPGASYNAECAQWHADFYSRIRKVDSKIKRNNHLKFYVLSRLYDSWSPEQIANRLKIDYPKNPAMRISHETIYKFIYFETKDLARKELINLLPYSKPKRSDKRKRRLIYMGSIIGRVSITERPKTVEDRAEEGHWEGDLVIGKGQTSAIGTLVERKSRYTLIVPLKSRKSAHVVKAFADAIIGLPPNLRRTLTYDNGIEMAAHVQFSELTKMKVYFANPYSSWERGTNENTNGLIRRVFKKKTDFNTVNESQLAKLQYKLNSRPRKVLGYLTPSEMLHKLSA